MVAGLQDFWYAVILLFIHNAFRAGENLRRSDTTFFDRSIFTKNTRDATRDGVDNRHRGHFATRKHRLANGKSLEGCEGLQDLLRALVDAFIASAYEDYVGVFGERIRILIRELLLGGRKPNYHCLFFCFSLIAKLSQ